MNTWDFHDNRNVVYKKLAGVSYGQFQLHHYVSLHTGVSGSQLKFGMK